jgi:hypothetical protein
VVTVPGIAFECKERSVSKLNSSRFASAEESNDVQIDESDFLQIKRNGPLGVSDRCFQLLQMTCLHSAAQGKRTFSPSSPASILNMVIAFGRPSELAWQHANENAPHVLFD